MDREDKRGIFFGVVGVLTLIVAIIGASLAYFSINAQSREDVLKVQAGTVQIVFNDGDALDVGDIIPSTREIALETYRRFLAGETYSGDVGDGATGDIPYQKCIDDKGYTVCGSYEFTLTNNGASSVDVTAKVVPTQIEASAGETEPAKFENLKFALYDITDVTDATGFGTEVATGTIAYTDFNLLSSEVAIASNATKKYRLFVWLDETGDSQDTEQGAMFKGTIFVTVAGADSTITGNADQTLATP